MDSNSLSGKKAMTSKRPLIFQVADITLEQHQMRVDNRMRIIVKTFETMRAKFSKEPLVTQTKEEFVAQEMERLQQNWEQTTQDRKMEIQKEINNEESRRHAISDRAHDADAQAVACDEAIAHLKVLLVGLGERPGDAKLRSIAETNYALLTDPSGSFSKMEMSLPLLREVTERYYYDSDVYKLRHEIHCSDNIKKAAILMKWVSRLRPICTPSLQRLSRKQLFANEHLGIFCACVFLDITPSKISEEVRQELLYTLRVHSPDEHTLIPIVRGIVIGHANQAPDTPQPDPRT